MTVKPSRWTSTPSRGLLCLTTLALLALSITVTVRSVLPATEAAQAPTTDTTPSPRRYILGRIAAQNGPTWTINGIRGNTYTVTTTPLTLYGRPRHGNTGRQFTVGDNVRIAGDIAGTAITATAITMAKHEPPAASTDRPDTAITTAQPQR
jgi:hypothetical protein